VSIEIRMPQLGMMMVEGTIVRWLVEDGVSVKAGDDVLEIESDKVLQTIPAPADGRLRRAAVEGQCVPVLQVVGYVLTEAEAAAGSGQPAVAAPAVPIPSHQVPLPEATGEIRATPIARRLAAQHGIDLGTLTGSGPNGRIVEADVQAVIGRLAASGQTERRVLQRIPLTGRRGVIARRMMDSLGQSAQLTIVREVEAGDMVAMRQEWVARADELGVSVRYDAILARVLATALTRHPALNAVVENEEIVVLSGVHVGIAVTTQDGLVVPVVRDADRKSLVEIARVVEDLASRARQGRLLPEEMRGGSVTLTNMGAFDVDSFTPILNPPESAILGIGRIAPRPVVVSGALAVRPTVRLSLTWDHRVADGAEAGALLATIAELIGDRDYLAGLILQT
jgi:pyruvate dehydrogenase E2 component (dihydrolipoamide acetyltransferase)